MTIDFQYELVKKQIALYRFLDAHPELQEFQNELTKELNDPSLTTA